LAAVAARALGAGDEAIREGLGRARWPGRFQLIRRDPPVIMDGAHNPAGARALAASLEAYFPGRRVTFVIGTSEDKDGTGILAALLPLAERVVCTAAHHPRASSPASLAALARSLIGGGTIRVDAVASSTEALQMALSEDQTPTVCVAGSLFLIGEILAQATEKTDIFSQALRRG
jgi:dihydrofolate synthase/folylpolyglutamate synthase